MLANLLGSLVATPLRRVVVGGVVAGVAQHVADHVGVADVLRGPIDFGMKAFGLRPRPSAPALPVAPVTPPSAPEPKALPQVSGAHDCGGSCDVDSGHACSGCAAKDVAVVVAGVSPQGGNVGETLADVVAYGKGAAAMKARQDRAAEAKRIADEKAADRDRWIAIKKQIDASYKATAEALAKLKKDMRPKLAINTTASRSETSELAKQAAVLAEQQNALRDMQAKLLEQSTEGEKQRAIIAAQSQGNPNFMSEILISLLKERLAPAPAAPAPAPQMPFNPYGYPSPWDQIPMQQQPMMVPNYDSTAFLPQMQMDPTQGMTEMEVADYYGNQVNGIEDPTSLLSGDARDSEYATLAGFLTEGSDGSQTPSDAPDVGSYSFADSAIPNLSDTNNLGDAGSEGDDGKAVETTMASGFWDDADSDGITLDGDGALDLLSGATDDVLLSGDEDDLSGLSDELSGAEDDGDILSGLSDELEGFGDDDDEDEDEDEDDDLSDFGDELEGADCRIGGTCGTY